MKYLAHSNDYKMYNNALYDPGKEEIVFKENILFSEKDYYKTYRAWRKTLRNHTVIKITDAQFNYIKKYSSKAIKELFPELMI